MGETGDNTMSTHFIFHCCTHKMKLAEILELTSASFQLTAQGYERSQHSSFFTTVLPKYNAQQFNKEKQDKISR